MRSHLARRGLLVAACAVVLPSFVLGADTTWTNATGNRLWADPANWTSGVPSATDTAELLATGSILLPSDNSATAAQIEPSFSAPPSSTFDLTGGRLTTAFADAAFSNSTLSISSDVGALSDLLAFRITIVNGTIGSGTPGGGTFNFVAINSRIRGNSTTHGQAALSSSTLEMNGSVAASNEVVAFGTASLNIANGFTTVDRLPDTGEVRLVDAILRINSTASSAVAETVGTLTLDRGRNTLWVTGPNTGSFVLTAGSLGRQPGAIVQLTRSTTSSVRFTTSPTGTNGIDTTDRAILGHAFDYVSDGTTLRPTFTTYDSGADPLNVNDDPGLRGLRWDEYATSTAAGGNVRLSGANVLNSSTSLRSLNLLDGSVALQSGATLTLNSGLMLQGTAAGGGIGGAGAIQLAGDNPTILSFDSSKRIDVPIHANSLTTGGFGELVLTQLNEIPGGVYVASGTLTTTASGALGTGTVTIEDGSSLRIQQPTETIQHLVVPGVTKDIAGIGTYGVGGFVTTLYTAPGGAVTINDGRGPGQLTLDGGGLVQVPAASVVTPQLVAKSGELRVNGTVGSGSGVGAVANGGSITGTGTIACDLFAIGTLGSVIAPGNGGVGKLNVEGSVSLGSGSPGLQLELELDGVDPSQYDRIEVANSAFVTPISYDMHVNYPAQFGDRFIIVDVLSTQPLFPPTGQPEGSTFFSDGYEFRISYKGGDGNDLALTIVPEPASAAMLLAAAGLILVRRRRRAFIRG